MNLAPIETLSLKETVYRRLLSAIVSGKLIPGSQITVSHLSEIFGVSYMPVREALGRLEAENLISVKRNRRTVIRECSKEELHEILQIRLILEGMAARKAVKNVDDKLIKELEQLLDGIKNAEDSEDFLRKNKEFHHTLYRNANMPILQEIIDNLWWRLSPYLHIYVSGVPEYKTAKIRYHEGILQGVKKRDARIVQKWLAVDLKKAAELVTGLLKPSSSEDNNAKCNEGAKK